MLNEKLEKYINSNYYPFHVPGHKRNSKYLNKSIPYNRDITEIVGFDNLNNPQDLFLDMQEALAEIFSSNEAIISTNGSTSGILSSIRTLTKNKKKILIGRNCHKSVYNAIELFDLDADFIKTKTNEYGIVCDIDYEDFEHKIIKNDYSLVLITSPSYEGYIINLNKIHELCKINNTFLVCDMAHGAHIHLFQEYKKLFSYDLAITSLHKNLSALTPSSLVLINNKKIDTDELKRNMAIFQTSSPSYLVLQSIDDMIENHEKFQNLKSRLKNKLYDFYSLKLDKLEFVNDSNKDFTKIVISTLDTNISGYQLQNMLLLEKIEIEMAQSNHVVLVSTIFDKKSSFKRLKEALEKIDKEIEKKYSDIYFYNIIPIKKMKISEAFNKDRKKVSLQEAKDKISGQFVYSYPPGIPLIAPGELITSSIINQISYLKSKDTSLSLDDGILVIY